jgi:hypothetical protein
VPPSSNTAMLRRQCASLHLELLQSIGKRQRQVQVVFSIVVARAIQHVCHAVGDSPGDVDEDGRIVPDRIHGTRDSIRGCHSRQEDDFSHIASVQWHLENPLVIDDCADSGTSGFHQSCVGLHFDCFRQLADGQDRVDRGIAVDLQDYSSLNVTSEARQDCLQAIGPNRQIWQYVKAGFISNGTSPQASVGLVQGHFHTRQNSSG